MKIVISSGHGKYVRGAEGYLDEVDEARRVVDRVADLLDNAGVTVLTFHDNQSHSQSENLERIVDYHNAQTRDLDVSVHFNAYETTSKPMGTECLYVTQSELASRVADAIASVTHLPDRGPKKRTDLYFLNNTEEPAILIETVFVDSSADADSYRMNFESVCKAIAETIGEVDIGEAPPIEPPVEPPVEGEVPEVRIEVKGKVNVWLNGKLITTPEVEEEWNDNITATVFAGSDDPQDSAYGWGRIDGNKPGVSVPYKWRDSPPPSIEVEGPGGTQVAPVVDVGPWNTNDPDYVLYGDRPIVEDQYSEGKTAQNGMVPSNDAAIDLTPATARAVGVEGKGKVKWRFATVEV